MLEADSDIFLQRPGEQEHRIVHPAVVVEGEHGLTVQTTEPGFSPAPGEDILIYFEAGRDFVKQPARIAAVMGDDSSGPLIGIEATGEPVSADTRECSRVSTVRSRLTIELDGEACKLTDVSVLGFSAIAERPLSIGEIVPVSLERGGETSTGSARVQSVKMLGDGRVRYGFLCLYDETGTGLQQSLQKLSMEIQRRRLRRQRRG